MKNDFVISKEDLEVEGGSFDYELRIKPDLTCTLDIDLSILYQEIDGKYNLHYEIEKDKNHIMIVSGKFDDVIVNSPLLEKLHPGIGLKLVKIGESLGFLPLMSMKTVFH